MTFSQVLPPAVPPLTRAGVKEHLRVSTDDEDAHIDELIKAAADYLVRDAGLACITQTWRGWFSDVPEGLVALPAFPFQRIIAVTWYDPQGIAFEMPGRAYRIADHRKPARISFDRSAFPFGDTNGVEIDFQVGFGDTAVDVPDTIKRALLVLIAHWFEFRGAFNASDQPVSIPAQYLQLIRPFRAMGL